LVRHNRWWLALASAPWLLAFAAVMMAVVTSTPAVLAPVGHFTIFGAMALFYAYKRNKNPRFENGRLRITEGAVLWGERELTKRSQLTGGLIMPKDGQLFVALSRKRRPTILLAVANEAEGRDILRALELDASQTVAEVRGLSPYFSLKGWQQLLIPMAPVLGIFAALPLAGSVFGPTGMGAAIAAMLMLLPFAIGAMAIPTKITIGADGILTKWLRWRSYFPFSEVVQVGPIDQRVLNKVYRGVQISLRDGSSKFVPITQKGWGDDDYNAVVQRIHEAVDVYRRGNAGTGASVLARNGRSARDWITALRRVGEGANADMRTAPVAVEQLLRIVEDLGATALARASAAIALAAQGSQIERDRIRIAAEATAAPKLRVALEKASASEIDDQELGEALLELEANEGS
jgi:hypothetical protein